MKKVIFVSLMLALFAGCKKGAFETKPQLKVKSLSTDEVPVGSTLRVILEFTDKEGDVSDSVVLFRERLNVRGKITKRTAFKIPEFPATPSAEIQLDLSWAEHLAAQISEIGVRPNYEPDTLNLKFFVSDKAGNKSDTASARVVVIR